MNHFPISQWFHDAVGLSHKNTGTKKKRNFENMEDERLSIQDLWPFFAHYMSFPFHKRRTLQDVSKHLTIALPLLFGAFCFAHSSFQKRTSAFNIIVTANVIISCRAVGPWLEKCCFEKNKQSLKLLMCLSNLFFQLLFFYYYLKFLF